MAEEKLKPFNDGLDMNVPSIQTKPDETWVFGGQTKIEYEVILKDGNWTKYNPRGERQKFRRLETMACVSYATLDAIETQLNRMIKDGLIDTDPIKDWIDENGDFNLSDRFIAKMSGTTTSGNNMVNPIEAIRKYGCPPESMWPAGEDFDWATYYSNIPQNVKDKAKELLNYLSFPYEVILPNIMAKQVGSLTINIDNIVKNLKQCPILIATACCPGWGTDTPVLVCWQNPNHATCSLNVKGIDDKERMYNGNSQILDHYPPFIKELSHSYFIFYATKCLAIPNDLILKKKVMTTAKIIKDKNSPAVGVWFPASTPDALDTVSRAFGIGLDKKEDGSIDWDKVIDGELVLK